MATTCDAIRLWSAKPRFEVYWPKLALACASTSKASLHAYQRSAENTLRTSHGRSIMNFGYKFAMILVGAAVAAPMCFADALPTHRIPAALAVEAASETIAVCAKQGYRETAVVLDADGATIVAERGDGAGIYTLDS